MESFKFQAEITRLASNSDLVPSNMREVNRHVHLSQLFDTRSMITSQMKGVSSYPMFYMIMYASA